MNNTESSYKKLMADSKKRIFSSTPTQDPKTPITSWRTPNVITSDDESSENSDDELESPVVRTKKLSNFTSSRTKKSNESDDINDSEIDNSIITTKKRNRIILSDESSDNEESATDENSVVNDSQVLSEEEEKSDDDDESEEEEENEESEEGESENDSQNNESSIYETPPSRKSKQPVSVIDSSEDDVKLTPQEKYGSKFKIKKKSPESSGSDKENKDNMIANLNSPLANKSLDSPSVNRSLNSSKGSPSSSFNISQMSETELRNQLQQKKVICLSKHIYISFSQSEWSIG